MMFPPQLIAPLSIVALGVISFIIRSIAEFQLEGTGSDLALISSSLQLSLIFTRMNEGEGSALQFDVFLFLLLFLLWAFSIKTVKKALQSQRRVFYGLNPYTIAAFVIGGVALALEIFWRLEVG